MGEDRGRCLCPFCVWTHPVSGVSLGNNISSAPAFWEVDRGSLKFVISVALVS